MSFALKGREMTLESRVLDILNQTRLWATWNRLVWVVEILEKPQRNSYTSKKYIFHTSGSQKTLQLFPMRSTEDL